MKFSSLIFVIFLISCSKSKLVDDNFVSTRLCLSTIEINTLSYDEKLVLNKKSHLLLLKSINNSITRTQLARVISNYENLTKNDSVYKASTLLLKRATLSKDSLNIGIANLFLAKYYNIKLSRNKSYIHFLQAIKFFASIKDEKKLAIAYIDLSILQYDLSQYVQSEKSICKAIDLLKNHENDYTSWFRAYEILGMIHCDLKDFSTSIQYHNKALKVIDATQIDSCFLFKEIALNNIGYVNLESKKYRESQHFFEEALQSNKFSYNPLLKATLNDNLAYSKFKSNDLRNLPQLFYDALEIRDSIQYIPGIISSQLHLSEYYDFKRDIFKSIISAENAYKISTLSKLPSERLLSLKQLLKVDKKNADVYFENYIKLSDSLQLAERKIQNKFARIAYETEELAGEKNIAIRQKKIVLGVSGSVLIMCTLLLVVRLQRNQKNELLFIKEQQKNDEIIFNLMHDSQLKVESGRSLEKLKIAANLQNGIINKLKTARTKLQILNTNVNDHTIADCIGVVDEIQTVEKEIRQIAHNLDSNVFSGGTSFDIILKTLLNQSSQASFEINSTISSALQWDFISTLVKMNIYRLLQEVIGIFEKYPAIDTLFITIDQIDTRIHITISHEFAMADNDYIKRELKSIKVRAKLFGANFNIAGFKGRCPVINIVFLNSAEKP